MKKYETEACRRKKSLLIVVLAIHLIQFSRVSLLALPQGEQVAHGSVTFDRSANQLTVDQASNKAIVNYTSFNIGSPETVSFNQPSSSAAILNRVTGTLSSEIAGSLHANGNVYLVNPNGILFSSSAQINVGGFVASGLPMADDDFLAGRLFFSGSGGSVINEGHLFGEYVSLIGSSIDNRGVIEAVGIVLAAGKNSVIIDEAAGGLIRIVLDGGDAGSQSGGEDLGQVLSEGTLHASGADNASIDIGGYHVDLSGDTSVLGGSLTIEAQESLMFGADSLTDASGNIHIEAQQGDVTIGGAIQGDAAVTISAMGGVDVQGSIIVQEEIELLSGGSSVLSGSGNLMLDGGSGNVSISNIGDGGAVIGGTGVVNPINLSAGGSIMVSSAGSLSNEIVLIDGPVDTVTRPEIVVNLPGMGRANEGVAVVQQAVFQRGARESEALSVMEDAGINQFVNRLEMGQELTRLESRARGGFPGLEHRRAYGVERDLDATLTKALEDALTDSSQSQRF